jgi:hypothetical protein
VKHEEEKIQEAIITAIRYLYPKSIIAAVPNGGKRNVMEAVRFKRQGVLAGFADIIFLHKGECLFFEVKAGKGKQTDNQLAFEKNVKEQGFKYYLVKSVEEVLNIIVEISTK